MNAARLLHTFKLDLTLQYRYGFYVVSGVMIVIFGLLISQLPDDARFDLFIPAFMLFNLMMTTFIFMGGLVLFEKAERVLTGLVVTPLRQIEYITSKVASLSLIACTETLLVIIVAYGLDFDVLPLVCGMVAMAIFYALTGFITIARYDSANDYLLPAVGVISVLILPALDLVGLLETPLFYAHPMQPMLVLVRGAFTGMTLIDVIYGLLGSLLWISVAVIWAQRVHRQFIVKTGW